MVQGHLLLFGLWSHVSIVEGSVQGQTSRMMEKILDIQKRGLVSGKLCQKCVSGRFEDRGDGVAIAVDD